MKPDQIYQALIELAERFDIIVSEQNFKATGVKASSGFCIVKEQKRFIVDIRLTVHRKIEMLASFLNTQPHENLYIIPAIREVLAKHEG